MVQLQLSSVGRGSSNLILPSLSPPPLHSGIQRRLQFYCCHQTDNRNERSIRSSSELLTKLLDRRWMLPQPDVHIHNISLLPRRSSSMLNNNITPSFTQPLPSSFYVIRDDLLHPVINGNKARKLDAILPILEQHSVSDVVTCGGCQSAHAAAIAVSCAQRGVRSHLLLRGEQPEIPTGYNLVSLMYGNVNYVPRSLYAKREKMLWKHASLIAGTHGSIQLLDDVLSNSSVDQQHDGTMGLPPNICKVAPPQSVDCRSRRKVVIVNEGAGGPTALLGVVRLVKYLSQPHLFGMKEPIKIILDAGTGTTATGLGLGVQCLGLPWKIVAVMLADTIEGYKKQEKQLISDFKRAHSLEYERDLEGCEKGVVQWVERIHMRKFGKVLEGEIDSCQRIARQTGILLDPLYTLAAWEHAVLQADCESDKVVMLHTGGTLGMFGLAQRYKSFFLSGGRCTSVASTEIRNSTNQCP